MFNLKYDVQIGFIEYENHKIGYMRMFEEAFRVVNLVKNSLKQKGNTDDLFIKFKMTVSLPHIFNVSIKA